jgi:hypothetical protein
MKMIKKNLCFPVAEIAPREQSYHSGSSICSLHTSEELASYNWHSKKCYKTLTSIREMLINVNSQPQGIIPFLRKVVFS